MERYSETVKTLFQICRPLSPAYSAAMRLRAFLYAKGIFQQHRLPALVISVGNLTLGGTGKTPLVQYIAKKLIQYGLKPAILSRGYGGRAQARINIVSDGKNILLDAECSGDEPGLLAENLPGVPVLTGNKRTATGWHAIKELGANAIVLDDGFQHLSVYRDIDLVLFHADTLLSTNRVLPGGDLREPQTALQRTHGYIISGLTSDNRKKAYAFQQTLNKRFPGKPIFTAHYQPATILRKGLAQVLSTTPAPELAGVPICGFCGIANPDSFAQLLRQEKYNIVGFKTFRDHHHYIERDIQELRDQARKIGAVAVITTAKDFVKLKPLFLSDFPIYSLDIEPNIDRAFDDFLINRIQSYNDPRQ
jgi:tetraacyldisaccharide 4'-kinase